MPHTRRDRRLAQSYSSVIEALERRTLLSDLQFVWKGGPGDWSDPGGWNHTKATPPENDRTLPNSQDTVTIPSGAGTVTVSGGSAKTINLSAELRFSASGGLNLYGNLNLGSSGVVTFAGGFSGLSFENSSSPQTPQTFNITGTLGGNATIQCQSSGSVITTGGGAAGDTLVLGANVTLRAAGTNTGGRIQARYFINEGTIVSDAPTTGLGVSIEEKAPFESSFKNLGTIRTSNGGIVSVGAVTATPKLSWGNFSTGRIVINGGTMRLGGTFQQYDLGNYTRVGGTVQVIGMLRGNLKLDNGSGSWALTGNGTLVRSLVYRTGNNALSIEGGTLDQCTLTYDVSVNGSAQIKNGLTLKNGSLRLNNSILNISGTQTISGSGQILFTGTNTSNIFFLGTSDVLTIGNGVVMRTDTQSGLIAGGAGNGLVVSGQLAATTSSKLINLSLGFCNVFGQVTVGSGAQISTTALLAIQSTGALVVSATSALQSTKNITGTTTSSARTRQGGTYSLTGGTGALPPQLLEVMSEDRGAVTAGFSDNFALGRLSVGGKVKLQDTSNNAQGIGSEVMYVDSLVVPAGTTLDLNGLKLYTRISSVQGTITGGTIAALSDGGPVLFALPTSGKIAVAGEQDEWTFFGRAGQNISAIINGSGNTTPGSPPTLNPMLGGPKLSLLTANGTVLGSAQSNSGVPVTLGDQVLPADGTYRLGAQSSAAFPTGNYNLTLYDITAETRSYLLNTTANGNIEAPFSRDKWTFALDAAQQIQFDLLAATTSGLQFTLEGPNGFVAFNNITDDSTLITIPGGGGGNYVLTARGATDQIGAYSFIVRDGSITPLTLGTPFAGTLPGGGASRWFSMSLPNAGQLLLTLDDSTNGDRNELYLRRGELPTRSEFDFRATSFAADGQIYVDNADAGDWYGLVYGEHVPAPSNYTLKAEYKDLRIGAITPDRYGVDNTMTMTLTGGGYEPGTTVKLVSGATTINASSVEIDSFTQITATFNLTGAAQATFDVRVEKGPLNVTLAGGFKTLPNEPAKLEMKLNMPSGVTRARINSFSVEYANTGNVAMPAPLMVVQSADPQGDQHAVLSLDMTRILQTFWGTKLPPGVSERVMMLGSGAVPGVLNPGEHMSIPINYLGQKPSTDTDSLLQLEVKCVEAAEPASQNPMDWDGLKDNLRPPSVPSPIWNQVYANITGPLATIEDYTKMLRAAASYLGRLGLRVVDIDDLWNFEVHKALGNITAFPTLAAAVDAQVPAPGTPLTLTRRFADGVIARNIDGPFGFGWTVPWIATLTRDANDDVITLNSGGGQRVFVRDGRAGESSSNYFSEAADSSTLKRVSSGIYELRETGGVVTRFRSDGKIDFVQDLNGNRVTANYNGAGRLVTLNHTSGGSISIGYNGAGRITLVTDSQGQSITYAYDTSADHLLSATSDDGTQLSYTYDSATSNILRKHSLLSEQMAGTTQFYSYDTQGRISSTSLAGGAQQVSVSYDQGQITLTDAAGANRVFFDHRVRVAKVTDARGFSSVMRYDKDDRLESTTLPDGSQQKYEFCDCGSLSGSTDALGRKAKYDRDPITRRLTSITDTQGNVSRLTYDAAGNQLALIHADGSSEVAGNYTATGLAQSYTNRRGLATTFVYDSLGRVTQQSSPNGTVSNFVYDARGRLATITQGASVTTLTYDTAVDGDRIKRVTYPGGKFVELEYDDAGRRTAILDQGGFTTRYDYDAAGRVAHVRDTAGAVLATYTYDGIGRLSRIDNGNNTFTVYGYDVAGNVLSIQNFKSAGLLNSRFIYTYDSRGRRTTATTSDGIWTYGYDGNSQLTSATFASSGSIADQSIQITYDAGGNREFATINGQFIDYGSNELNQITSVDGITHSYDADGNLISDGMREYAYDALGRLVQITDGSDVQKFEYNAFGARSASVLNGVRTDYLVLPDAFGEVLAEYDGSGNLLSHNIFNGTLLGKASGAGAVSYFDFDITGSTAGVSDSAGTYVNRYAYDPFGRSLLSNESIANTYEFNGMYGGRAELGGLSQMGLRDYSANLGRFTTIDPLRFDADLNTYRFADNSPTMRNDPTGLFSFIGGFPGTTGSWFGGALYGTGIDGAGGVAVLAQTGGPAPGVVDWLDATGTSFGLNAAFSMPGLNGIASGMQVFLDPKINSHHVNAICGLNLQRTFGTINQGAARQMAALQKQIGGFGAGGSSVSADCFGRDGSGDADMGVGNRCGYGEVGYAFTIDPNDKFGPVGFGLQNRVPIDEPIDYIIDFENIGPGSVDDNGDPFPVFATAAAQRIVITDQLSANLDWSTVLFTQFSFGETIIPVSDGFGAFHTAVDAELNGVSFVVQIDAEIDVATGLLSVIFQAIDPVNGLPPDVFTGLLPPEDGMHNGMGYFKFSVKPLQTLADGTQFRNIGQIRFDSNDVIPTNQVDPLDPTQGTDPAREALVTIDALPPIVTAGPDFVFDAPTPRITVQFSEDVSPSLSADNVIVQNLTTPGTVTSTGFSFDAITNTATFTLPVTLLDGNYELLIPAANISDGVGHPMPGDVSGTFFVLSGDANHDRSVDLTDFTILAANFNSTGARFANADFNYDGTVDLTDFTILASKFNQTLAPAGVSSSALGRLPFGRQTVAASIFSDVLADERLIAL